MISRKVLFYGLAGLALCVLFALDASAGKGNGNGNGGGNGGGGGPVIKGNPSFATDIQEIFNRKGCTASQCHGVARNAGLDLRAGSAHANLVNVTAQGAGGETRVIPGDAQNSYLVKKLEGRGAGSLMPLGGTPLDNTDLTNIRNWINQGASNN